MGALRLTSERAQIARIGALEHFGGCMGAEALDDILLKKRSLVTYGSGACGENGPNSDI